MDTLNLILLVGVIAIFWRLFKVLGRRTGFERPPSEIHRLPGFEKGKEAPATTTRPAEDNVITLPGQKTPEVPSEALPNAVSPAAIKADDPLGQTLTEIALQDRAFEMTHFLDGARQAYAMIIRAFAAGDRQTLRPLLADDVYESFESAIKAREDADQHMETRAIGNVKAAVIDARIEGKQAHVTVRFKADLVSFIRDRDDKLIDGNPTQAREVTDIWTFTRSLKSRDPNWLLVATENSDQSPPPA